MLGSRPGREGGCTQKSSPLSSPVPSWLWFPKSGSVLANGVCVRGQAAAALGPQAPGIPPLSSPRVSGPLYKAQGAKQSVWPCQLSPEAPGREPKPEVRWSHPPKPACSFPEPLASDLWPSGCSKGLGSGPRWGKLNAERALGVGGVHAPGALHALNSSASVSLAALPAPAAPCTFHTRDG